jgi:hypothetical protein
MNIALIKPHWHFNGSIYLDCPAPHRPLPELEVRR